MAPTRSSGCIPSVQPCDWWTPYEQELSMGSSRRGGRRTRTIPSIFASCFVVLAGNAALATAEPPETQEVAYYVTNELFLFVCWKIQDQCTAYGRLTITAPPTPVHISFPREVST